MPTYNYLCSTCEAAATKVKGLPLTHDELWEVIFETAHSMKPKPKELLEARRCPRCGGTETEQTMMGCAPLWFTRGAGFLDKPGCHRDMNLFKLTTDDPYADMREPGEADDLAIKLKRGGQHNPRTKHFKVD